MLMLRKNSKQNSTTRAFQLTKFILDRVKRNPREYDAFIDVLNERPDEHRDILGILDTSYQQLSEFIIIMIKLMS